jgi:hypothetical protein
VCPPRQALSTRLGRAGCRLHPSPGRLPQACWSSAPPESARRPWSTPRCAPPRLPPSACLRRRCAAPRPLLRTPHCDAHAPSKGRRGHRHTMAFEPEADERRFQSPDVGHQAGDPHLGLASGLLSGCVFPDRLPARRPAGSRALFFAQQVKDVPRGLSSVCVSGTSRARRRLCARQSAPCVVPATAVYERQRRHGRGVSSLMEIERWRSQDGDRKLRVSISIRRHRRGLSSLPCARRLPA